MTDNQMILNKLQSARLLLDNGTEIRRGGYLFICEAITRSWRDNSDAAHLAKQVVMDRLAPYTVVEDYLHYGLNIGWSEIRPHVQEYRGRWLDSLIQEYQTLVDSERQSK